MFGSYARDEQRPDRDINILIELDRPPRISLIGLLQLQDYRGDVLGAEVDIFVRKNLRKRTGRCILSEVIPI